MTTTETYPDEEQGFGWLFFSGTVLGLAGIMRIIDSIWAFRYNGALPDGFKDSVLGDNLTTYAWVWLIVGVILLVSSFLLLARSQFARWIGLIAAAIGGIERDDVDAVLPGLVAHLRRDRRARALRTHQARRPHRVAACRCGRATRDLACPHLTATFTRGQMAGCLVARCAKRSMAMCLSVSRRMSSTSRLHSVVSS